MIPDTASPRRIGGYDVARAIAVLGMVIVNFRVAMGAEGTGPRWLEILSGFVDGKAAATFVVLAGVGISLFTAQARSGAEPLEQKAARKSLLNRAMFLFLVGLAYTPIWPGDILHFYGVYLALAAFTFLWPNRNLWTGVALANLVFLFLLLTLDYGRGWNWETLDYSGFWTISGMIRNLLFNGFHPVFPWIAFLFAGMWLGRRDLREPRFRMRVLESGVIVLLAGSVASSSLVRAIANIRSGKPHEDIEALFGTAPMPPNPFFVLVGLGTAFAVIALSVELEGRLSSREWMKALVATGQLSLTIYVAHVVIGMGFLDAVGLLESQSMAFATVSAVVFILLAVAGAWFWRRRFARGPLETIMRRVTG